MAKAAPKRKAANGYKLAEPLPKGAILEDLAKKKWKLGPSIGQGGFGEIYSAQEADSGGSKYPYVIKIEPHGNGPLFVEMHFYMRNCKPDDVEQFKKQKGLKTFGMPVYLGSGSHEHNGEKYRFIVMQKFGTDLWKLFLEHNRTFPATTVFKVAIQILDVLQYIHERGYVHADIKGANILMGVTKDTLNKQVYLVDFGLAAKYNTDAEFKPNPKKAHDGTIEYLSRDAHKGVQTRRGDLEILAYNIIQWLGCVLPWEKKLKDPVAVHNMKEENMASVPKFIKACFEKRSPPGPVVDFLNCILTLDHNSAPDYKTIRKIFLSGVDGKDGLGKPLQFSPITKSPTKRKAEVKKTPTPKRKPGKRKIVEEPSEDEKENVEDDDDDKHDEPMETEKEEETLSSEIEEPTRSPTQRRGRRRINYKEDSDDERNKVTKKKQTKKPASTEELHVTGDSTEGFTDAMKEVLRKKQENGKSKGRKKKAAPVKEDSDGDVNNDMEGYTESMKEIANKNKDKPSGKRGKKADLVPVATSSKAKDKKGLKRSRKNKKAESEPINSDVSEHESDSE
nr:serine/threonine-protein kinase VRK1-like [Leptinotarsa decemlineata]